MFEWLLGSPKPLLPKTVTNVNSTVVPTGVPATQGIVPPSQAANVATAAAARVPPSEIVLQPRRGEYVALGGSRKSGKGRKGRKGKSRKGKSKASKSRK